MSIPNDIQFFLKCIFIIVMAFLIIGYMGLKLAKKHGKDIRIVWYLFSLASVATCIVAIWGCGVGAIDEHGVFKGELGAHLNELLNFMLDIHSDIYVFLSILAITILPQIISYLMSGLFGCASSPIFVGEAFSFFVWSVVKTLVIATGVFISVVFYSYLSNWNGISAKHVASTSSLSAMLLMFSFSILYIYRDIHAELEKPTTHRFPKLHEVVLCLQCWLSRKLN